MFINKEAIYKSLEWHSSPVDWCEPNYQVFSFVAEFYNTFSCLIFLIVPPIAIYLFRGFAARVNHGIQAVMVMLIVVGVTSMYFHGTLSLMGQLMDELSILWVYALGLCFYCPSKYIPKSLSRGVFSFIVIIISAVLTVLSVYKPFVNAFAQMSLTVPVILFVWTELKTVERSERNIHQIAKRTLVMGLTAITLWFNDRLFCEFYKSYGIVYLHAVWHILSFTASYYACVLGVYFYLKYDEPSVRGEVVFWPSGGLQLLSVPYVSVKDGRKINKKK